MSRWVPPKFDGSIPIHGGLPVLGGWMMLPENRIEITGVPFLKEVTFIPSNVKAGAAIDTGSQCCQAKYHLIESLGRSYADADHIGYQQSPQSGAKIETYYFNLRFTVQDNPKQFELWFGVVQNPGYPYDVLLGGEWIKKIERLTLFGSERRFELII